MPGPQNKTLTIQGASAVNYQWIVTRDPSNPAGPIYLQLFGVVTLSDGTSRQIAQSPFILGGAFETTIRNAMDGAALTKMRSVEGIEAP